MVSGTCQEFKVLQNGAPNYPELSLIEHLWDVLVKLKGPPLTLQTLKQGFQTPVLEGQHSSLMVLLPKHIH